MKPGHWILPSLLAMIVVGGLHALTLAASLPDHLKVSSLTIETAAGQRHEFQVHEAVMPADQQRGLMFVENMGAGEGMLFNYGVKRYASMWMKNTPLPLDMLFIREDGTISSIVKDTVPFSRRIVSSREPVRAVLELNGGTCETLGIEAGDRVLHTAFGNTAPAGDG